MKENKIYYNLKGNDCKRIICVIGSETLTAKQVLSRLLNQKQRNGKSYRRQPTINRVSNILSKYPIFEKVGLTNGGHSVLVNTYRYIGD
jgi:hypothetical protein